MIYDSGSAELELCQWIVLIKNSSSHLDMITQLGVRLEALSTALPFALNGAGERNGRKTDFLGIWKRENGVF